MIPQVGLDIRMNVHSFETTTVLTLEHVVYVPSWTRNGLLVLPGMLCEGGAPAATGCGLPDDNHPHQCLSERGA